MINKSEYLVCCEAPMPRLNPGYYNQRVILPHDITHIEDANQIARNATLYQPARKIASQGS